MIVSELLSVTSPAAHVQRLTPFQSTITEHNTTTVTVTTSKIQIVAGLFFFSNTNCRLIEIALIT